MICSGFPCSAAPGEHRRDCLYRFATGWGTDSGSAVVSSQTGSQNLSSQCVERRGGRQRVPLDDTLSRLPGRAIDADAAGTWLGHFLIPLRESNRFFL